MLLVDNMIFEMQLAYSDNAQTQGKTRVQRVKSERKVEQLNMFQEEAEKYMQ